MKVGIKKNRSIVFSSLNRVQASYLQKLFSFADFRVHKTLESRLFPKYVFQDQYGTAKEPDFDWQVYVNESNKEEFFESMEIVRQDIDHWLQIESNQSSHMLNIFKMRIPWAHGEHWFRVLNQARMYIYYENEKKKKNITLIDKLTGAKSPSQADFYALLQEYIVEYIL